MKASRPRHLRPVTGKPRRTSRAELTLADLTARDIMTQDPMIIEPTASVSDAAEVLSTLEIRHLPVMNQRELVGIISERDLAPTLARGVEGKQVRHIMNSDVIAVRPDSRTAEIVEALLENRVGALPVVDDRDGALLGIVSYVDVLRALGRFLAT